MIGIFLGFQHYFATFVHCMIGLKYLHHFLNQSEVKPKPITPGSHMFCHTLPGLHVFGFSFYWFTGLSESLLCVYFGLGFRTLDRNCSNLSCTDSVLQQSAFQLSDN